MPSSIFSSESLRGFSPKLPAAALTALALVVGIEAGLRLMPDAFVMRSGGWLGELYYAEQVVLPRSKAPKVVVMGSSTAQIAAVPTTLERELGLPEGGVCNLAIRGGRPFDALTLYQRQRATLKQAEVVVLALNTWTFNASYEPTARYRLRAPFEERWTFADGVAFVGTDSKAAKRREQALINTRQRLLIDSALNMRVLAPYARSSTSIALRLSKKRKFPVLAPDGRMQVGPWQDRGGASSELQREAFELLAEQRGAHYGVQPIFVEHVRELARLCKEDGVRLVLIQIPCRAFYQEVFDGLYPLARKTHLETSAALAKELDVPWWPWLSPADVGIDDTGYIDYGHMAGEGAEAFSQHLAKALKSEGIF